MLYEPKELFQGENKVAEEKKELIEDEGLYEEEPESISEAVA